MKIDNKEIVSMANMLRDEDNGQLHIRPWKRRRNRFRVPAWLVAVPAAAITGFFFGIWSNSRQSADTQLAAIADTVYITVKETVSAVDTLYKVGAIPSPATAPVRRVAGTKHTPKERYATMGHTIATDRIRYDLLVKN